MAIKHAGDDGELKFLKGCDVQIGTMVMYK